MDEPKYSLYYSLDGGSDVLLSFLIKPEQLIRGILPPTSDGKHVIRICLFGPELIESSCSITWIELGPPHPKLTITQPLNGSFIADDPITFYFIIEDFGPEDGEVRLVVDSGPPSAVAQWTYSELPDLSRGAHQVCFVLIPRQTEEFNKGQATPIAAVQPSDDFPSAAASDCVRFTVRRPELVLLYPTADDAVPVTGPGLSLTVKLMVLHLAHPVLLSLQVHGGGPSGRPATARKLVRRADYQILTLALGEGDLDLAAGQLYVRADLYSARDAADNPEARAAVEAAAARGDRGDVSAHVLCGLVRVAPAPLPPPPPSAPCRNYFIDAVRGRKEK